MSGLWRWLIGGGVTMLGLVAGSSVLCFLIAERLLAARALERRLRRADHAPVSDQPPAAWAGLRRMGLIRACIVTAPLLGLLGTVNGIVDAFQSILQGGYVTEMSQGIFKALRTTQYGLSIAACGLLGEQWLLRRIERLRSLRDRPTAPAEEA